MPDEQAKTIEALRFAIQIEIKGKEYYQKASQKSRNKIGKELLQWLAGEEDKHRQRFEDIYQVIKVKKAWPEMDVHPSKTVRLGALFSKAKEEAQPRPKAPRAELKTIAVAMETENKTHDFYESQSKEATYDAQSDFYKALAAEERGHYLALVDYREYLINPAGWFRQAEHHSLDGG